jgi:prevent-host-death family protein
MQGTLISASNLRTQTRDVMERVRFRGEHFIVQTFGKPVAVIISIEDYAALLNMTTGASSIADAGATVADKPELTSV